MSLGTRNCPRNERAVRGTSDRDDSLPDDGRGSNRATPPWRRHVAVSETVGRRHGHHCGFGVTGDDGGVQRDGIEIFPLVGLASQWLQVRKDSTPPADYAKRVGPFLCGRAKNRSRTAAASTPRAGRLSRRSLNLQGCHVIGRPGGAGAAGGAGRAGGPGLGQLVADSPTMGIVACRWGSRRRIGAHRRQEPWSCPVSAVAGHAGRPYHGPDPHRCASIGRGIRLARSSDWTDSLRGLITPRRCTASSARCRQRSCVPTTTRPTGPV